MSSSSMTAVAASVQPAHVENDRQPSTERPDRSGSQNLHLCTVQAPAVSPAHEGRSHKNGYRYGPGNWVTSASKPEINTNRTVPGVSIADVGFELLAHDGTFVSWFLCPLDAVDAMKLREGACKIVRCSDRALIKVRYPRRGRCS